MDREGGQMQPAGGGKEPSGDEVGDATGLAGVIAGAVRG
jgi:hypothetical protein